MRDFEKNIRRKLAEALGSLGESIIRRDSPFDSMPLQPEVVPYYYQKYVQYLDDIEEPLKTRILQKEIDHVRWLLESDIVGFRAPFIELYPQHVETDKVFSEWISSKESPRPVVREGPPSSIEEKIRVAQIIKGIVKSRRPEFSHD